MRTLSFLSLRIPRLKLKEAPDPEAFDVARIKLKKFKNQLGVVLAKLSGLAQEKYELRFCL